MGQRSDCSSLQPLQQRLQPPSQLYLPGGSDRAVKRGFGGRPATTLKVTSGPGSLQRPVLPAKPQGFRKPQVGPLTRPRAAEPLGSLVLRGPLADQAPGLQLQWARLLPCDEEAQRTPRAVQASGLQPQWAGFTWPQISRGARRHRRLLRHSAPRSGAPGLLGTSRPLGRSSPRASVSVGQVACMRQRRHIAPPSPFKPQGFSVSGPVSLGHR
jgi:hypothetical protein